MHSAVSKVVRQTCHGGIYAKSGVDEPGLPPLHARERLLTLWSRQHGWLAVTLPLAQAYRVSRCVAAEHPEFRN